MLLQHLLLAAQVCVPQGNSPCVKSCIFSLTGPLSTSCVPVQRGLAVDVRHAVEVAAAIPALQAVFFQKDATSSQTQTFFSWLHLYN